MRVPEQIHLRVVCNNEADLSGLIVELIVTAGPKNPYRIYFPKTDISGVAVLTHDKFVGQFRDHWEANTMDHNGTPETADPRVRVGLYDPRWSMQNPEAALAWPLLTHERTKWSSREAQYRLSNIVAQHGV